MAETDYKKAYERQKQAREKAETLLEDRSRELYESNNSLREALELLQNQQNNLIQQEKLAALGMLSAGIAHEINNPIGFISSNLQTLEKYFEEIETGLKKYEEYKLSLKQSIGKNPEILKSFEELEKGFEGKDVAFLCKDAKEIIQESLEGSSRVARIIYQLRTYARGENDAMGFQDINKIIDNMLNLAQSNLKHKCVIKKDFGKMLPVYGSGTQLGQVLLNIVINASQAIHENGIISISTSFSDDFATITIRDNGNGIEKDKLEKIFDPFFTTKQIGEGTGLGLSIVRGIIEKHRGTINVESKPNIGTTFTITLPLFHARKNMSDSDSL